MAVAQDIIELVGGGLGGDDTALINSALQDYRVVILRGIFRITSSITVPKATVLIGVEFGEDIRSAMASYVYKDGIFDGIVISGEFATIERLCIFGPYAGDGQSLTPPPTYSAGAVDGDGIVVNAARVLLRQVGCYGHGQNGIRVGKTLDANCNENRYDQIRCERCGLYGAMFHSNGERNSNICTVTDWQCRNNRSHGFYLGNTADGSYVNLHSNRNYARAWYMDAQCRGNWIIHPWEEHNNQAGAGDGTEPGRPFIAAGAINNRIIGYGRGAGRVVTNQGDSTNVIDEFGSTAGGIQVNPLVTKNLDVGEATIDGSATLHGEVAVPSASASVVIATGAVTVTRSNVVLDTEGAAATDDLDTVSGLNPGAILVLQNANAARVVTCKSGTGNLFLQRDRVLSSPANKLILMKNADGSGWDELSYSSANAPPWQFDKSPTVLVLAADAIAITSQYSYYQIDTEAAAANDTLSSINGADTIGQPLLLETTSSARDVTCEDNTGNLRLGGNRLLSTTQDKLLLVWTGQTWQEVGFGNNA